VLDDTGSPSASPAWWGHGKTRKAPFDQARPFLEQYEEIGHYFTRPE
jgi:hypothetical protein